MKAGLFLTLWEVTTLVSMRGCLYIFAGPTSGKQMAGNPELNCQEKNSVLSLYKVFSIHLQKTVGYDVSGKLAPLRMNEHHWQLISID